VPLTKIGITELFDDDDGALSLEGYSLAFVEVYFGM
jgi:hypothetical protein